MPTLVRSRAIANGVSDATFNSNPFLLGTGWDVFFNQDSWPKNLDEFEIYQMALDGPVGVNGAMYIDGFPYNYINQMWANSNDPSQVLRLATSQTIQFYWNASAATTTPEPIVTLWLRGMSRM